MLSSHKLREITKVLDELGIPFERHTWSDSVFYVQVKATIGGQLYSIHTDDRVTMGSFCEIYPWEDDVLRLSGPGEFREWVKGLHPGLAEIVEIVE